MSINSLSIVEYFPQSFDRIKQFYSNSDILASLLSPYNYKNLINLIQEKGGNSEAFIFSTYDEKFILKTITKAERKFFVSKLLPNYLERLEKAPQSNLVRILGVFKIYPLRQSVMIMENLIYAKKECVIFDLKGSKVARLVKGIENPRKPPTGIVLKDENFFLFNWKIKLAEDLKKKVLGTLIKDFNSLKECGVTDYSLILAIYSKSFNEKVLGRNVIIADDGTRFCIGIIDILQEYNFTKASEKMIKSIFEKEELISAAEPEDYFNRIAGFVSSIFE